jgi:hypothetical protein
MPRRRSDMPCRSSDMACSQRKWSHWVGGMSFEK